MNFEILIHDDLSLSDLIKISKNKGVVLKTPHVGNIYPNNLLLISLGIPTLFYDRTLGVKDRNFHPDTVIFSGKSESIADPRILTTHALVKNTPRIPGLPGELGMYTGSKLVDFHMSAVKRALPHGNCFTYGEYLQENKEIAFKILEETTKLKPELWSRNVDSKGVVTRCSVKDWQGALDKEIFGITSDTHGLIIPNPVNILFHGVIDTLKSGASDIYLLSGPDMYRYISGYSKYLSHIYAHLRKIITPSLPSKVHCHVIPVSHLRFLVDIRHRHILDQLISTYLEYVAVEDTINAQLKYGGAMKSGVRDLINVKNTTKSKLTAILKEHTSVFKRMIFYNIEEANCFTQYDLFNSEGLYIHSWGVESKMRDVSKAFKFLSRLFLLAQEVSQEEILV